MATCTWESVKADANTVVEKLRALVHEGNVRRVVVDTSRDAPSRSFRSRQESWARLSRRSWLRSPRSSRC